MADGLEYDDLERRKVMQERFLELYPGDHPPTVARIRAAAEKSPAGKCALGFATSQGLYGLPRSWGDAVRCYRAAADAGHPRAHAMLSSCYRHGLGVVADPAESERLALRAAELGDLDSMFNAGLDAANRGDSATAAGWYRKGADGGSAGSMTNLGMLYEKGDGVPQSWPDALKLYREAAVLGDTRASPAAAQNLCNCYTNGWGVEVNLAEAASWLERAAKLGSAEAMFDLGYRYERGQGLPADMKLALACYASAADSGHPLAIFNTANCLKNGWGSAPDPAAAAELFQIAAELGVTEAKREIAKMEATDRLKRMLAEHGVHVGDAGDTALVDPAAATAGLEVTPSHSDDGSNEGCDSLHGSIFRRAPQYPPPGWQQQPVALEATFGDEDTPLLAHKKEGVGAAAHGGPPSGGVVHGIDCPTCDGVLLREEYAVGEHNAEGYENGFWCDLCGDFPGDSAWVIRCCGLISRPPTAVTRVHCRRCVFDLCLPCFERAGGSTMRLRTIVASDAKNLSANMLLAKHFLGGGRRPTGCGVPSAVIGVAWLVEPVGMGGDDEFQDIFAEAAYLVGQQFETGGCLPCKPKRAAECMEQAAAAGNPDAVQWMRLHGKPKESIVNPDAKLAAALAAKDGEGIHDAAEQLCRCGRREDHVQAHLAAAELGYGDSMDMLGYAYHHGIGVDPSPEKAFEWYSKGADAGSLGARINVGVCYVEGVGVPRDTAKALPLYRAAAEGGSVLGMNNLAYLLKRGGDWGPPDEAAAFHWYKMAAEHPDGGAQAMSNLVQMYEMGVGTAVDRVAAFRWAVAAVLFGKAMYVQQIMSTRVNADKPGGIGCSHAMRLFINGREI
mmetsp:Transcript_4424/g.11235  ORF Transcript_4424/g.11235 Transcript_4424/m.11235 type:complete len:843 (+) Transcript_4424:58-2586(+)